MTTPPDDAPAKGLRYVKAIFIIGIGSVAIIAFTFGVTFDLNIAGWRVVNYVRVPNCTCNPTLHEFWITKPVAYGDEIGGMDVLIKHTYWNEEYGGFWETTYMKLYADYYNGTHVGEYHPFIQRGWMIGNHSYIGFDDAEFINNPNATRFIDDLSYYTWARKDDIIGEIIG